MLLRLNYFAKVLSYYFSLPNLYFVKRCVSVGTNVREFKYQSPGQLVLRKSGIIVEKSKNEYLINSVVFINDLCSKANAVFRQLDGKLIISLAGLQFEITDAGEIFILYEIFVKGEYNYWSTAEFVLIDIGMNVGIASLYFAQKEMCREVIGFEPFKPTYDQALTNIKMNVSLLGKIRTYNFGLGSEEKKLELKYNPALKGVMSTVYGNQVADNSAGKMETVEIKNAQRVFEGLGIAEYKVKGYQVVVKMDCEGAEYQIIPELKKSGDMRNIDAMMIEWHGNQPKELKSILKGEGFAGLLIDEAQSYGMIYAFRK